MKRVEQLEYILQQMSTSDVKKEHKDNIFLICKDINNKTNEANIIIDDLLALVIPSNSFEIIDKLDTLKKLMN